jgi:hypothetical protein
MIAVEQRLCEGPDEARLQPSIQATTEYKQQLCHGGQFRCPSSRQLGCSCAAVQFGVLVHCTYFAEVGRLSMDALYYCTVMHSVRRGNCTVGSSAL